MRTAEDFVELARERHGLSYYAVAKHLEITPSRLIRVRSGNTTLTEPQAEKLAELCGLDPGIVYAEAKAARAKRTDVRAFWERVARSLAATLAVVFVGIMVAWPSPAQADATDVAAVTGYTLCALARALARRVVTALEHACGAGAGVRRALRYA